MPANHGMRTATRGHGRLGAPKNPRFGPGTGVIALSIRLDEDLHNKLVRSAELNERSIAGEAQFQLRKIYAG